MAAVRAAMKQRRRGRKRYTKAPVYRSIRFEVHSLYKTRLDKPLWGSYNVFGLF